MALPAGMFLVMHVVVFRLYEKPNAYGSGMTSLCPRLLAKMSILRRTTQLARATSPTSQTFDRWIPSPPHDATMDD